MLYTVFPVRLRQEPVDVRAFDSWQDSEGLVDATEDCRQVWRDFRPEWRRARALDLARPVIAPAVRWDLSEHEQWGARRARALGAAFAMCASQETKRPLSRKQRDAWFRWRSRCQRAHLGAWQALWPLLDGEPLEDVALRQDEKNFQALNARTKLLLRWLLEELQEQVSAGNAYR